MATSHAQGRTRGSWIERLRNGDSEAWEEFLERYGPLIIGRFQGVGLQSADFEDLRQDILVKIYAGIGGYTHDRTKPSFRCWVATVVRTQLVDYWRSVRSRKAASQIHRFDEDVIRRFSEEVASDVERLVEEDWLAWVRERVLAVLKERIPPAQWDVFVRLEQNGQAVQEVAQAMGLSTGTVCVYRSSARKAYGEIVEELDLHP